jgi:nucleoside-diphosphate-sugar epimerase
MTRSKVLVSGGTGYVGRFIVDGLPEAGYEVAVGTRHERPFEPFATPVRTLRLALGEPIPAGAFDGIDCLVHAAFDHLPGKYRGGEGDNPDDFRRRNLDGSVALFEAARAAGVGKVVFLSSRAVYGAQPVGAELFEDTEPHPDTLYGEVKRAAERHLVAMEDRNFRAAVLRVTGVYGAAARGDHKWGRLIDDYLAGNPVSPRVATEVHGADVTQAVAIVLGERSPTGLFNVSDILVDHRDLLAVVKEMTSCEHALPDHADPKILNAMNTSKLRALGWRPGGVELFKQTVRQMVQERLRTRTPT